VFARRAFFSVDFFSSDFNVPFTTSGHAFMARRCFSTARLRQQLVALWTPESAGTRFAANRHSSMCKRLSTGSAPTTARCIKISSGCSPARCKAAGRDRRPVFFTCIRDYEGLNRARNREWKPTFESTKPEA
jgi:hypothetical protein